MGDIVGTNRPLQNQITALENILLRNSYLAEVFAVLEELPLANYYVAAGAIAPYMDLESAVNTFPTTSTAVGCRFVNGKFQVYAPFGLNDLFSLIVRPNKTLITEEIYLNKINKWRQNWDKLHIIEWGE